MEKTPDTLCGEERPAALPEKTERYLQPKSGAIVLQGSAEEDVFPMDAGAGQNGHEAVMLEQLEGLEGDWDGYGRVITQALHALCLAEECLSALLSECEEMKRKADYYDELVDRSFLSSLRVTAKQLGVGEKALIRFLLQKGYLYRDQKGKLMPYARQIERGLFAVKECYNEKNEWSGVQTLVTPKGRERFQLLLNELKGE